YTCRALRACGISRQRTHQLRRRHGKTFTRGTLSCDSLFYEYLARTKGNLLAWGIRVPVPAVCSEEPALAVSCGRLGLDVPPTSACDTWEIAPLVGSDLAVCAFALTPQL